MKQCISQPSLAAAVLFIPERAMFVSVTMLQPRRNASSARSTALSENARFTRVVEIGGAVYDPLDHRLVFGRNLDTKLALDYLETAFFDFIWIMYYQFIVNPFKSKSFQDLFFSPVFKALSVKRLCRAEV